jgi:hypothetical protein
MPNIQCQVTRNGTNLILMPTAEDFPKIKGLLERTYRWLVSPESEVSPFNLTVDERAHQITVSSRFLFTQKPSPDPRIHYMSIEQLLNANRWQLNRISAEDEPLLSKPTSSLASMLCFWSRPRPDKRQ